MCKVSFTVPIYPGKSTDFIVFPACNHLRGLEKSQSLLFLIPPEVSHNMRSVLGISSDRDFTSADVLKWSMAQTCQSLDNLRPLWANQGLQYHRRIELWDSLVEQPDPSKETAIAIQEPEARTLSQLYAPWDKDEANAKGYMSECGVENGQVQELLKTLQSASGHITTSAYLHEEQEREIACEVEREQQVSRPPSYTSLTNTACITMSGISLHSASFLAIAHPRLSHWHSTVWRTRLLEKRIIQDCLLLGCIPLWTSTKLRKNPRIISWTISASR